jgi:hypothetical protein
MAAIQCLVVAVVVAHQLDLVLLLALLILAAVAAVVSQQTQQVSSQELVVELVDTQKNLSHYHLQHILTLLAQAAAEVFLQALAIMVRLAALVLLL